MNSSHHSYTWRTTQKRSIRLVGLIFFGVMYAAHWAIALSNRDKQIVFVPITFGLAVLSSFLLSLSIARLPDKSDSQLDERQKSVRDGAYRIAFLILIFTALLATVIIGNTGISVPDQHRSTFISSLFICAMTLPAAVIAWLEPEPIPDLE